LRESRCKGSIPPPPPQVDFWTPGFPLLFFFQSGVSPRCHEIHSSHYYSRFGEVLPLTSLHVTSFSPETVIPLASRSVAPSYVLMRPRSTNQSISFHYLARPLLFHLGGRDLRREPSDFPVLFTDPPSRTFRSHFCFLQVPAAFFSQFDPYAPCQIPSSLTDFRPPTFSVEFSSVNPPPLWFLFSLAYATSNSDPKFPKRSLS